MKNKVCVYTCITGNYDDLKDVEVEEGIDYICFTNNKNISSNTWQVIYIDDDKLSNIELARKIKILGHPMVNNYDILLWMDGAIKFKKKIKEFIEFYLGSDDVFVAFKHSKRSTIKEEAEACIAHNKEKPIRTKKLFDFYKKEKYPDNNGLIESTVYIKRPKERIVQETMKLWFSMIINYSTRDQLSFNYCIYKTGMKVKWINDSVFSNEWFLWIRHNSDIFNNKYKIYFDYGNGFEEKNSIEKSYGNLDEKKEIVIDIPQKVKNIRIDPTDCYFMHLENMKISETDLNSCYFQNIIMMGKVYCFLNDDPYIVIGNNNYKTLKINFELYENDGEFNKKMIKKISALLNDYSDKITSLNKNLEQKDTEIAKLNCDIRKIYESTSWKITKPLRCLKEKVK